MLIDTDTLEVQVNSETIIPLPELVAEALKWKMIVDARHVMVAHSDQLQLIRVGTSLYYSFQWTCDCKKNNPRFINWTPRAGHPPTEKGIELTRTVPGFMLGDFIRAMSDPSSDITSNEQFFTLNHDQFGFLEIA